MGVKVFNNATQEVVEVDPALAAEGISDGRFTPAQKRIKVVREGQTGTVDATELANARGHGWEVSDEAGAMEARQNIEAHSTGSQLRGGAEALASGATLGLSSMALEAIGVDPEEMRRRREATGGGGTALELIGAAVPAALSGGGSLAGRAGVEGAKRGLAATLARATPAGLATRGAARLERGLASTLGRESAAARILPSGARNFVEGAAQGAGTQLDENVLGDRELTADLLGSSMLGGLFGAGAGYGVQGLASVASGGARASVKGMQGVLGRLNASTGGMATREAAEIAIREGQEALSPGAKAWMKSARFAGVGDDVAERLAAKGDTAAGRAHILRVEREMPQIQEQAAKLLHERVPQVHASMDEARRLAGGASKSRYWERQMPKSAEVQRAASGSTDDLFLAQRGRIEQLAGDNVDPRFPGAFTHSPGVLREADNALTKFERDLVDAEQLSGTARATKKAMAADAYKRALGEVIDNNGGWGKMRQATPEIRAANVELRKMYGEVKGHLERSDLWGEAATTQGKLNSLYSQSVEADDLFREAASGSGLATITNPDGTFNMQKALKLVRAHGKLGGDVTVFRLTDALKARVAYFDELARHVDADDAFRSAHGKIKADVADIERQFKSLADDAGVADDLKSLRDAQGNKSPSHTLLTTQGPALAGMLGFGFGGPVGGAIGMAAGALTQPHRTLLNYAQMRSIMDKADVRLNGAIAGMFDKGSKLKLPKVSIPRAPVGVTGKFASSDGERKTRRETAIARAIELSSSPEALERALAVPHYDLHNDAPALAGTMQQRAQNAAKFLQSKAPKVYTRGSTQLVDPLAASSFERYLEAVQDPIQALGRFSEGRITSETAEAIKVCYPALWADVQSRVQQRLADMHAKGEELPYDTRCNLGRTFDVPADPSMVPATGIEIQMAIGANFDDPTAAEEMGGGNAPKPSQKAGKIETNTKALMTGADRSASWRTA